MTDTLSLSPPLEAVPAVQEALGALGGFAVLGLCAGLGAGDLATTARAVPSGLLVGTGALLLSGPALVVAHQFLRLEAPPEALVGALGRAFVQVGRLALGFSPFVLFFAATSGLAGWIYVLVLAGIGLLGLSLAGRDLVAAERGAGAPSLGRDARMALLTWTWAGLAGLVALRIGWDVAHFVLLPSL